MNLIVKDFTGFDLPIFIDNDQVYYRSLEETLNKYTDFLKQNKFDDRCLSRTKSNVNKILSSLSDYYQAKITDAQKSISQVLKEYINSTFVVSELRESYAFKSSASESLRPPCYSKSAEYTEMYDRMLDNDIFLFRSRISATDLKLTDMLHIPFDKRSKIESQRFSISGVPCFYFSYTSFGTWLELGQPPKETLYVSAYKFDSELIILNLCYYQDLLNGLCALIQSEEEKENAFNAIEIFPLVIATSFKVKEDNRKFKSEYIISQLVMQAIRELGIDGVAYLSKRMEDKFAYPQAVNLAILMPSESAASEGYWNRIDEISLTEPICFGDFIKNAEGNKKIESKTIINKFFNDEYHGKVLFLGDPCKYKDMCFSRFDEYLIRQKMTKYEEK
jgi:SPBc2 prophage-derived uncharacterized protein yopC